MALLDGKIGDKVRIIEYGSPLWITKQHYKECYEAGMTGGKERPEDIIDEDERSYMVDIHPTLVGKKTIITKVTTVQGRIQYATELSSWFGPNQLELIIEK